MLWQDDNANIKFVTTTFVALCIVSLGLENFLPKQNIDKVMILRLVNNKFSSMNTDTFANTSSLYYMNSYERILLNWYRDRVPEAFLTENDILGKLFTNYTSSLESNKNINQIACHKYLERHKYFKDIATYANSSDPAKTLALMQSSIDAICKILSGNLGSFFDNKELNDYFLNSFLTEIESNFLDEASIFTDLATPITTEAANIMLGKTLKANMQISLDRWNKILACKSTYLYNPDSCFTVDDYNLISKQNMIDIYSVDYSSLETHFKVKQAEYDSLVSQTSPQVDLSNTILAIRHLMARGNLVFVYEADVYAIQNMLTGAFISNEAIKSRCSGVNIWTERCRTKNIKSVSVYCAGDNRVSGSDTMTHTCLPIDIDVKSNNQGILDGTVFSAIGKEATGFPSFSYQVYFWSFYDKQEFPRVPV